MSAEIGLYEIGSLVGIEEFRVSGSVSHTLHSTKEWLYIYAQTKWYVVLLYSTLLLPSFYL